MKINKHTLSNGLRIVHSKNESTSMVCLNLMYLVGARDEDPEHTGFAHLFEHLMFGGTENFPNFDEPIQLAGGTNNAWTSSDVTNYYITIPKQNVEIALCLESDRMRSLAFSEESLEVQRKVVIEEFKQRSLNQPYGDFNALIRDLSYSVHPYRWSVIGKDPSHIENATMEQVKEFFFKYYAPNNAILSVTGNIEMEELVGLVERWFGDIPQRSLSQRQLPQEPLRENIRRAEVFRDVPTPMICMTHLMPSLFEKDFVVCDLISDILANGKSARLKKYERDPLLCTSIDAYVEDRLDKGLFFIVARPAEGVSLEEIETVIEKEIQQLQTDLIGEYELQKLQNKHESAVAINNLDYMELASQLAKYEIVGDANKVNDLVESYNKVTPEQIRRVAQLLFNPNNRNVLYYKTNAMKEK